MTEERETTGRLPSYEMPRESVRKLQRYLRELSYRYPEIPRNPIDGILGPATLDALRAFQRLAGLRVTGEADPVTWALLYEAYLDVLFGSSQPKGLPVFPISPADYRLKKGDVGFSVSALQYLLSELSTRYDFPAMPSISGIFDDATEDAVKETQRSFLLSPSGEVDKRLWNYLVGALEAESATREDTT